MAMTKSERLIAGAEALEEVARWSEQPGEHGVVSAFDLFMRAAALRAQADVLNLERVSVENPGSEILACTDHVMVDGRCTTCGRTEELIRKNEEGG